MHYPSTSFNVTTLKNNNIQIKTLKQKLIIGTVHLTGLQLCIFLKIVIVNVSSFITMHAFMYVATLWKVVNLNIWSSFISPKFSFVIENLSSERGDKRLS